MGKRRDNLYAHSREGRPPEEWQPLEEHLRNVADLAAEFAKPFGAEAWAYLAGLWHDVGKGSDAFQTYLRAASEGAESPPKTDHSTAGAKLAVKKYPILGHLLAYAIAGHHAGLPDGISEGPCLERRLKKSVALFSMPDLPPLPEELPVPPALGERDAFGTAFFVRMLFSCLVDADSLDTERFMDPEKSRLRGESSRNVDFTVLEKFLLGHIEKLAATDSPVNRYRSEVLGHCLRAASERPGFFSLTVPTGGGKTLSSLAFALKHAAKYGKSRVIYVIPFTSIIEQTADVFRKALGASNESIILEHHSNFVPEDEGDEERVERWRLATENWDAPIVVTTAVQFYESLFSNRASACRKLHNIANAVVIFDEAQTLPVQYIEACLKTLKELVRHYSATVVLCTATQPAIQRREDFPIGIETHEIREMVPETRKLYLKLKRVDASYVGQVRDQELVERLSKYECVLCIVNTRGHAKSLFGALKEAREADGGLFHLSALMCPAHRRETLKAIRSKLKENAPCLVVSTQLVEAGVDLDFPVVYRSLAGLDSLAQAAGRCNREGRLDRGRTYVFKSEHVRAETYFAETANCASQLLELHPDNILDPDLIERFFKHYYRDKAEQWDAKKIMREFTLTQDRELPFLFSFASVAGRFRLIDDYRKAIVIPWDKRGGDLVHRLHYEPPNRKLARALQPYTVSVNPRVLSRAIAEGRVETIGESYNVLVSVDTHYSRETGLILDDPVQGKAFFG